MLAEPTRVSAIVAGVGASVGAGDPLLGLAAGTTVVRPEDVTRKLVDAFIVALARWDRA